MSLEFRAWRDKDGNVIDGNLCYPRGTTRLSTASTASASSTDAFTTGTEFVELLSNAFCYYRLSTTSTAEALLTDTPLAANVPRIVRVVGKTHFQAIAPTGTARVHATELGST